MKIRKERPGDADRVHDVTARAFQDAPHTDHTEQFIVKALREAGALSASLVAEEGGEIVGHVAISPVSVSDGSTGWYGLGPVSVLPEFQRGGIGSRLVETALAELEQCGASGCVVLGDPAYYRRFGFRVVDGLVLAGVPLEYFQALYFDGDPAQGNVTYHEAFSAHG